MKNRVLSFRARRRLSRGVGPLGPILLVLALASPARADNPPGLGDEPQGTCHVANPPTCHPSKRLLCRPGGATCKCVCVPKNTAPHLSACLNDSVAYVGAGPVDMKGLYPSLAAQRAVQNQLLNTNLSQTKRETLYRACTQGYKLVPVTLAYLSDDDGTHATGRMDSSGQVHPLERFPGDPHDYRAGMISLTNDILLASGACFGLELKGTAMLRSTAFNRANCGASEPWNAIQKLLDGGPSSIPNPDPALLTNKNVVVWMNWGRETTNPDLADVGAPDSQGCSGGVGSTIRLPPVPRNIYLAGGYVFLGTSHLAHELGHHLGAWADTLLAKSEPLATPSGHVYEANLNPARAAKWTYPVPGVPHKFQARLINRKQPLTGPVADSLKLEVSQALQSMGPLPTDADLGEEAYLPFGVSPFCGEPTITVGTATFKATDAMKFNTMSYFAGNQELRRFSHGEVVRMEQALAGTLPADVIADAPAVNRDYLAYRVVDPVQHPTLPYAPYQPSFLTKAEWELMVKSHPDALAREFVTMGAAKDVPMATVTPGTGGVTPGSVAGIVPH